MAETADLSRLTTFQNHVDDMRNLVMCKICLKPLYEPFILVCGHTYCYGCLRSWFSGLNSRKRRKNCPDCRSNVELTPSPNYILRDLVHMFISRAELLPEDETVDEHLAGKLAEAELMASDKGGPGLFEGVFEGLHPWAISGPIHVDGVLRCPRCTWEIEDGTCLHCGYSVNEDEDYPDFSDEEEDDSMIGDDDSIGSDDMSDGSGHGSVRGLGHHFYGVQSAADDIDPSIASDIYSELGYNTANPYHGLETDDDEMDGFINDLEDDDDEPDELDEDDMDGLPHRYVPRPRVSRGRIPRIIEDDDDDDEDEDDSEEDEDNQAVGVRYHWHPAGPISASDESSDGEGTLSGNDDENQDQQTIYDESEEDSRGSTPTAMPIAPRRRLVVISDDEDDDDEDLIEGLEQEVADSHTEGHSQSEGLENNSHASSDSGDAATPPQPSAYRRQRLDVHRKRRRTPDTWRTIARGRERPASRRESQQESDETRRSRSGPNFLRAIS